MSPSAVCTVQGPTPGREYVDVMGAEARSPLAITGPDTRRTDVACRPAVADDTEGAKPAGGWKTSLVSAESSPRSQAARNDETVAAGLRADELHAEQMPTSTTPTNQHRNRTTIKPRRNTAATLPGLHAASAERRRRRYS
jgi:hypothetical protein